MCDETTEAENSLWATGRTLGRREFSLMTSGVAAAMLLPGCASGTVADKDDQKDATMEVASRTVSIETPDGSADAFFVHPVSGSHPAVIMWPDVAGLREAYRTMGSRLAEAGYAVLVVNQYYRSAPAPILDTMDDWRTEEGRALIDPMREKLSPAGTTSDALAFVAWLDKQAEVDTSRKMGTCGYCMGGPFTLRTSAARPERVGALASFHGGGLVTPTDDSPHLLISTMKAAMLIAIAQNDDARDPDAKTVLMDAAKKAGRPAEIEVYPAQHGWCTIDAPIYDEAQAEKAWSRMLAIFSEYL
ncbi:MAG: dienelactone hydrolase family protein [Sphingobium sp.]